MIHYVSFAALIGPFNCLPFRISEAIPKPLSLQRGMPLLAYESDGYAVSPSFLRQVEVHIEQVLERAGQRHEKTFPAKPWRPFLSMSKANGA